MSSLYIDQESQTSNTQIIIIKIAHAVMHESLKNVY